MSKIEIQSTGVGRNTKCTVLRDGKVIGRIAHRSLNAGWIVTTFYGVEIARGPTLDVARKAAEQATWPSRQDVYDNVCAEIENSRREYAEMILSHALAEAARAYLGGASGAELESLVDRIETFAKDRVSLEPITHPDAANLHAYRHGPDRYPDPPATSKA